MNDVLFYFLALLSFSVQSAFGFGGALILIPVLTLKTQIVVITPLLAIMGLLQSIGIAWESRHSIKKDLLWQLLLCVAATAPVGIFFVTLFEEYIVKTILGFVIVAAGSAMLVGKNMGLNRSYASPYIFGPIAGVLGGSYNTMGPPLVIFLQLRGLDPASFRATLHAFTVWSNVVILFLYWQLGHLQKESLEFLIQLLLPLLIGSMIGKYIFNKTKINKYGAIVSCLLILLGFVMIVTSSKIWISNLI